MDINMFSYRNAIYLMYPIQLSTTFDEVHVLMTMKTLLVIGWPTP